MEYFIQRFTDIGGVFGLLFGGSLFIIFFLYKENRTLQKEKLEQVEKRVEELKAAQLAYTTSSEANRSVAETGYRIAENTFTVVQNLQQLLNMKEKKHE